MKSPIGGGGGGGVVNKEIYSFSILIYLSIYLFACLFIYLYVATYDLGKVRLKPVQSAVSPFTVRDLWGSPLETCRAIVSRCITHAALLADHRGSFALHFSESLRILAPSPPSLLVAGL